MSILEMLAFKAGAGNMGEYVYWILARGVRSKYFLLIILRNT